MAEPTNTLRPLEEIILTHDLLTGFLGGELKRVRPQEADRDEWETARSVLCWVLQHRENPTFGDNLAMLTAAIREAGYAVVEGKP